MWGQRGINYSSGRNGRNGTYACAAFHFPSPSHPRPDGAEPQRQRGDRLLSVKTHRRAATGNTKSQEIAGALAGTAPSSTARNPVMRPEIMENAGRVT